MSRPATARPAFDVKQATAAIQSGGIVSAVVRHRLGLWVVEFVTRENGVADLVKFRRGLREFANPGNALKELRGMGLTVAQVQMETWNISAPAVTRWTRPDQRKAMTEAHAASRGATAKREKKD